jgi:L-alanine-DL-glutamate epimerase-like enolase superfamily enzyme
MKLFVKRAETAREAVGPDVEIIMENHCLTSANTAIQYGLATQHLGFMMLEEPANPLNPCEYRRIAEKLDIPVATGERSWLRWGFQPLFEAGLSVAQPDLGNCGGITEGRKIADMAAAYGVTIQTHTCNTPLSVAASLHLEAAIPNFIIHEHHTVNTLADVRELCVYDYQPVNGYFDIPELPGIGNEPTEKALAESSIITVK